MSSRFRIAAVLLVLCLPACSSRQKGPNAIGEAYVGPATLNIRQELTPKSPVVGVVKHGDRLEILQTRRRFVKVRTPQGAMGWTDTRQLLSTEQMQGLRKLADESAKLPSQGRATVFDALNIHSDPSRSSPSFAQIPETGAVEVLGHRIAPKTPPTPPPLPVTPKPVTPKKTKEKKDSSRIPPPPMPDPPKLPPNWLELSRVATPAPGAEEEFAKEANNQNKEKEEPPVEKPLPMEDWSLVRTKEGKVGWVLSRNLIMAIPDEVAQYAEGKRITSYFALADIVDGDQTKHAWLWTTMARPVEPYEFDSFRVFVWSLRRHRYETAYIDRNVKGYYPVEAHKGTGDKGDGATFSLVLDKGGQIIRKTFAFNGYRVTLTKTEPWQLSQPVSQEPAKTVTASSAQPHAALPPGSPWYSRLGDSVRSWFR